ncbi:peptide ABC transporter substrate-binding protein [Planctomycetales bacterium ZRK34]|nr:peptide ABC transporter substrate-binding protein [Planctomycetales bacterium ZRK34]
MRLHARPATARWLIMVLLMLGGGCDRVADAPADQLVIAISSTASGLDPHTVTDAASMRLIENMYDTLMRYTDRYGEVTDSLATSHAVSADGRTITFTLPTGVRFHSGRVMTAADVAYSLKRIIDKQIRAEPFAAVESIDTPNDHTVVLRLSRPDAALLTHLAYPMNVIVDRTVVEAHDGALGHIDAGSGPFELVEWRQGDRLILKRFEEYYVQGVPQLERVVFRPLPDPMARSIALRTGQIQLVLDVPEKDIEVMRQADHVTAGSAPGTFWEYIGLNCSRKPFDDARVRQAIAWAVDREQINRLVKLDHATVLEGGSIPPTHWAFANLRMYPQWDVDKARALLAKAGYPDGFETTLKVGSAFDYQVRAAEVVKQQLAAVGIIVRLDAMESTVFFSDLGAGDFDMTLAGWVGFVDPDGWLYNLFTSGGKYNQQQYTNPQVDELLRRGRRTLDRDQRITIYRQAQRLIAADAPVVSLYVSPQTSAWRDNVHGYQVHPTATTRSLRHTRLTD